MLSVMIDDKKDESVDILLALILCTLQPISYLFHGIRKFAEDGYKVLRVLFPLIPI